jgi:hypothetical protein
MTPVFRLCDDYVRRWAVLDPVRAGIDGFGEPFGAATDYGPDGIAARADLIATTLAALDATPVTSEADRQAAAYLRERMEAEAAWHQIGEPSPRRRRFLTRPSPWSEPTPTGPG